MKIKLYREEIDDEGHTVLTDGRHVFFACTWTERVRWALRDYPDDGLGIRTHGAAKTLELAVQDARAMKEIRDNWMRSKV